MNEEAGKKTSLKTRIEWSEHFRRTGSLWTRKKDRPSHKVALPGYNGDEGYFDPSLINGTRVIKDMASDLLFQPSGRSEVVSMYRVTRMVGFQGRSDILTYELSNKLTDMRGSDHGICDFTLLCHKGRHKQNKGVPFRQIHGKIKKGDTVILCDNVASTPLISSVKSFVEQQGAKIVFVLAIAREAKYEPIEGVEVFSLLDKVSRRARIGVAP